MSTRRRGRKLAKPSATQWSSFILHGHFCHANINIFQSLHARELRSRTRSRRNEASGQAKNTQSFSFFPSGVDQPPSSLGSRNPLEIQPAGSSTYQPVHGRWALPSEDKQLGEYDVWSSRSWCVGSMESTERDNSVAAASFDTMFSV